MDVVQVIEEWDIDLSGNPAPNLLTDDDRREGEQD